MDIGRNGDEIDIPDGPAVAPPTDVAAPRHPDRATQDRATPDRDAPVSGTPDGPRRRVPTTHRPRQQASVRRPSGPRPARRAIRAPDSPV